MEGALYTRVYGSDNNRSIAAMAVLRSIKLTHQWLRNHGWENTIWEPWDFDLFEFLGQNKVDGLIFYARIGNQRFILKGYVYQLKPIKLPGGWD